MLKSSPQTGATRLNKQPGYHMSGTPLCLLHCHHCRAWAPSRRSSSGPVPLCSEELTPLQWGRFCWSGHSPEPAGRACALSPSHMGNLKQTQKLIKHCQERRKSQRVRGLYLTVWAVVVGGVISKVLTEGNLTKAKVHVKSDCQCFPTWPTTIIMENSSLRSQTHSFFSSTYDSLEKIWTASTVFFHRLTIAVRQQRWNATLKGTLNECRIHK